MEYTIEFGGTPQDVTITTTGVADAKGLVGLVRDLVASPDFRPGMLILENCLELDVSRLRSSELREQADAVVGLDDRIGASKCAIVVPGPATFGLARMWQAYVDSRAAIESQVFYSLAEGREWLESKRPTPSDGG